MEGVQSDRFKPNHRKLDFRALRNHLWTHVRTDLGVGTTDDWLVWHRIEHRIHSQDHADTWSPRRWPDHPA